MPAEAAGKGLQTCLIVSGQYAAGGTAAGCNDADSVKRDGLFSYEVVDNTIAKKAGISTGSYTVDGLVPDGATNVTITYGDDMTAAATVKENAMSTTVPGRPTSVTFTDANGAPRSFKL